MRKIIPIVLTLVAFISSLSAQDALTGHYQMTTLDLSTGLPNNNVNQFFVDSKGFVWISTYGGGAVRYDGFSFMPIGQKSSQGLSSISCKGMTEDLFQRLWIAYDERTDVIDMRTMSRTNPPYGKDDISRMLDRPALRSRIS